MAKVKPFCRHGESEIIGYTIECPGCKSRHSIYVNHSNNNANWQFNGNVDSPTFKPSLLIRSGHYASHHNKDDGCWCTYKEEHPEDVSGFECGICHSFITDGKIQFLGDCTHHLAGQTVDLPELED